MFSMMALGAGTCRVGAPHEGETMAILEATDIDRAQPTRSATGSHLAVDNVSIQIGTGETILDQVSVSVAPGQLVAIIGASGAGKSTLLDVMAGNLAPTQGDAWVDGVPAHVMSPSQRQCVGFVPQTDDTNEDLPLERMLQYAARLRRPKGTSAASSIEMAAHALAQVELTNAADVPVKNLSGGQARRASIAVELVTSPEACLLDEPTSGLDPTTAETVVKEMRTLADSGSTVVFVTHNANDLRWCDRIISLGAGGQVVFDGTQQEAMTLVGSNDTDDVHRALTSRTTPDRVSPIVRRPPARTAAGPRRPSRVLQWMTLTARTLENVIRNKLTLAIMIGSPVMVIAMFAVLFQPGAFDPSSPSPSSTIMITFWVAFGGFFFGLTYGLLQIVPEVALIRRERRSGVSPGLQVLAKLTALAPVLIAIDIAMLAVLVWLDRLPSASFGTYVSVGITLALDALAALALGLLASAVVKSPSQASLALPMLCFPAVLFSGAILAVPAMAPVGRAISAAMSDRWAFEAIGNDLGLRSLFAEDPSALGPALLNEYGDTWTISHMSSWLTLAGFTLVLSAAAWAVLAKRCQSDERTRS